MNPQLTQQIKQLAAQLKSAQNPDAFISQILLTNPQIQNAIQLIKNYGGNPETAFKNYAQQLGINPQQFLIQLQNALKEP